MGDRKKELVARNAEEVAADLETKEITAKTRPLWPHPTIDVDEQDVREDEMPTPLAQHLQVEIEALQDVVENEDAACKEHKDHHFMKAKVKEELDGFF
jgi:hypothetical protein